MPSENGRSNRDHSADKGSPFARSLVQKTRKSSHHVNHSFDERFASAREKKNFRVRKYSNRDRSGSRSLSVERKEELAFRTLDEKEGESEEEDEEERKKAGKKLDKLQISLQRKEEYSKKVAPHQNVQLHMVRFSVLRQGESPSPVNVMPSAGTTNGAGSLGSGGVGGTG